MARGSASREQAVPVLALAMPPHSGAYPTAPQPAAAAGAAVAPGASIVLPGPAVRPVRRDRKGGQYWRVGIAAVAVAALVCCVVSMTRGAGEPRAAELLWDPYALEDAAAEDHDLWGGRNRVAEILRSRSAHIATRVGRRFQDDSRIGVVLGHAAHVAFDTIVEIKRAMRGLQYESEDSVFNSKIEVAETMLAHLMSKLGISEVPPPPHTTRLASVKTAMRMARDLRMILSKIPTGTDARDYREARYNLAVYDLDQVSRQISQIMLDLSEDNSYQELQEPSFSRFDAVMADAQAGLADADDAFGGGEEHNKAWDKAEFESKMNLLPKWQRHQEEYAQMAKGEEERLSQRLSGPNEKIKESSPTGAQELPIESIIGDPSPEMDMEKGPEVYIKPAPVKEEPVAHAHHLSTEPMSQEDPVVCVDAQDHHPGQDIGVLCPHGGGEEEEAPAEEEAPPQSLHFSGEALIREAVAAAMKQDARAESSHPALVDRLAERKIEATAVRSVMNQLEQTENNRPFAKANLDGRAEPVMGRDEFVVQRPSEYAEEQAPSNEDGEIYTNALKSSGRIQSLALIPQSMLPLPKSIMAAATKVAAARAKLAPQHTRGAAKLSAAHAGKARLQSLSDDPRMDVTVAGENGFTDPKLGVSHATGGSTGSEAGSEAGSPAQIEAREEDESQRKVDVEQRAAVDEQERERGGVGGNEYKRDGEGAGAYLTVDEEGGDVTSGVQWPTSPEPSFEPRLPYNLQLEKDAVYQASKTGMIMELNHPGWQDSVENAASVAVDAAIRAETYNGGDALAMVERAAVEGATKAAKEMEIKAEEDGSQGPAEQAVAQRVENSAVRAAIMASNEVQSEHSHKAFLMRPAAVQPLTATAMPPTMTVSSSTPGAAQMVAAGLSGAYGYQMPASTAAAVPPAAAAATAMGGAPMLASSGGVAFAGGSSFVPDAQQGVPGMVEGTMYVPE